MANVKTYNLTIYMGANKDIVFRGISRVAVRRYINHYLLKAGYSGNCVEAR
jgi:hypothetical protein